MTERPIVPFTAHGFTYPLPEAKRQTIALFADWDRIRDAMDNPNDHSVDGVRLFAEMGAFDRQYFFDPLKIDTFSPDNIAIMRLASGIVTDLATAYLARQFGLANLNAFSDQSYGQDVDHVLTTILGIQEVPHLSFETAHVTSRDDYVEAMTNVITFSTRAFKDAVITVCNAVSAMPQKGHWLSQLFQVSDILILQAMAQGHRRAITQTFDANTGTLLAKFTNGGLDTAQAVFNRLLITSARGSITLEKDDDLFAVEQTFSHSPIAERFSTLRIDTMTSHTQSLEDEDGGYRDEVLDHEKGRLRIKPAIWSELLQVQAEETTQTTAFTRCIAFPGNIAFMHALIVRGSQQLRAA